MNQVVEQKRTPMTVAQGLRPQIAETLPKHIDADAFTRTVQTALQVQPELLETSPRSLMIACMKAATDGLIIDGREAALVVRKVNAGTREDPRWEKQAVYQPMVQGLMKLARNSGTIVSITAHIVFRNDRFTYVLGDDERIEHEPAPFGEDRGDPIAAYAIVKLTDGTAIREVMRASEILNIASQGSNSYQYDPSKGKNWGEWWRKTVIRRITKYIPRSSDKVGAFTRAAEEIDNDFDYSEDQPPAPAPVKKRGAAAAALKDITPARPVETPHDMETGEVMESEAPMPGDDI